VGFVIGATAGCIQAVGSENVTQPGV